ncbi:MAG: PcfJ domain-containing protein [Butyrivibrio sp.]|nr:PcfJ domain-containing protein [Butyrivibrio sp.]
MNAPTVVPAIIENKLVFRVLSLPENEVKEKNIEKEVSRLVFLDNAIIKEDADGNRAFTTPLMLTELKNYNDGYDTMCAWEKVELLQEFAEQAEIANKKYFLMAMDIADRSKMFRLAEFLKIYRIAAPQSRELNDIPRRIVRELLGRKMAPDKAVRIEKDLVVVTGQRKSDLFSMPLQIRAYFDGSRSFFFIQSPITGAWLLDKEHDYFQTCHGLDERCIDKDLFENTCMERFVPSTIEYKFSGGKKINFGEMLAQSIFLSAEQAAKVDYELYKRVLDSIYEGEVKDTKMTLPELLGITGRQVKFLKEITLPLDLMKFVQCMKDPDFKQYFPDVKKRMFAASFYLEGRNYWGMAHNVTREEVFQAAGTINSLEKIEAEKREHLCSEYYDYIRMRRRYLAYRDAMKDNDPLYQEVMAFGDAPINTKPSAIKDKHDKIGRMIDLIGCVSQIEKYDARISNIKEKESSDWEYRTDKYSIVMPENARDIINEGRQLNHCVGRAGYIEKMAKGNCRILFLRSNNDIHKPLITIEEVKGVIRQCYGYGDSINTNPEIRDFIKEYAEAKGLSIQACVYSK